VRPSRVLLPATAVLAIVAASAGQERVGSPTAGREALAEGARLYDVYCSNCHGVSGKGDGPTAELLRVPPSDLTRLSRHDEFPSDEVYEVIDGRKETRGHGYRREMPIWGLAFQELGSDLDQQPDVRRRLHLLVDYLESIQDPR
jgi:mono/diheme cytochrome c family protein